MEKLITYETPNVAVYEIHSQRALCGSVKGAYNPNDLTEGQLNWFEEEVE